MTDTNVVCARCRHPLDDHTRDGNRVLCPAQQPATSKERALRHIANIRHQLQEHTDDAS